LGDEAILALVRAGIGEAGKAGMDEAGMTICIFLMFLLGCGFARDPQYGFAERCLGQTGDHASMAAALHRGALEYLDLFVS
jgi:hypothetical protein